MSVPRANPPGPGRRCGLCGEIGGTGFPAKVLAFLGAAEGSRHAHGDCVAKAKQRRLQQRARQYVMPEDEHRLRHLLAAATPGTWQVEGCRSKLDGLDYQGVGPDCQQVAAFWVDRETGDGLADAHLAAHAVNMLPRLLEELDRLRAGARA